MRAGRRGPRSRTSLSAGPDDPVFVLDAAAGEVVSSVPPCASPTARSGCTGRVPAKGEQLRLRSYATGGGRGGNVSRGAISVLKSSIPYVARVENRHAARGGVDGEDLENAKQRGPILLRTRARAVTAEDFEQLSREAAPEVGRVRCLCGGRGSRSRVGADPRRPVGSRRARPSSIRTAHSRRGDVAGDRIAPRVLPGWWGRASSWSRRCTRG